MAVGSPGVRRHALKPYPVALALGVHGWPAPVIIVAQRQPDLLKVPSDGDDVGPVHHGYRTSLNRPLDRYAFAAESADERLDRSKAGERVDGSAMVACRGASVLGDEVGGHCRFGLGRRNGLNHRAAFVACQVGIRSAGDHDQAAAAIGA